MVATHITPFLCPRMPVRLIIALLGLATLAPLAIAFLSNDDAVAYYAIPAAVAFAVAFVFKPELDWAYYTRYPSDLDAPVVRLLEAKRPGYYARRTPAERLALRQRTALTVMGLDFKPQTQESTELPEDFAALLAIQLARLTVGLPPKHAIPIPFEVVVVYRHPFPSRQYPKLAHNSELYPEDGVVLVSLHQALPAALDPDEYFNITLYEWIRACRRVWGRTAVQYDEGLPEWRDALTAMLARPSTWIGDAVGLPELDNVAVLQVLRLEFPAAFAVAYPELAPVLADDLRPPPVQE